MTPGRRKREQILEATRAALVEVGFENITTRRIAEAAGVNIAALHYYFGSKEALLTEAVRYALGTVEERLRAAIETAPTAAVALEAALDVVLHLGLERRGVLRYDMVVRGMRDPEARQEAAGIYAVYRRVTEEIARKHIAGGGTLAPGLTIEAWAHYVVAAVDGVMIQFAVTSDEETTRRGLAMLQQHALALLGAGKEENDERA